jgi:hypothetical protein
MKQEWQPTVEVPQIDGIVRPSASKQIWAVAAVQVVAEELGRAPNQLTGDDVAPLINGIGGIHGPTTKNDFSGHVYARFAIKLASGIPDTHVKVTPAQFLAANQRTMNACKPFLKAAWRALGPLPIAHTRDNPANQRLRQLTDPRRTAAPNPTAAAISLPAPVAVNRAPSPDRPSGNVSCPTVYSYIVTHDTGFAPNPFHDHCTLACCKPAIRRTAGLGDWIVGISPKPLGNRLVYAMHVAEILTFEEYWSDLRFQCKIPAWHADRQILRCGDNIYEPLGGGQFRQHQSFHSLEYGLEENPDTKNNDLGGRMVLVAKEFTYWGRHAVALPESLTCLVVGRSHRTQRNPHLCAALATLLDANPRGVLAPPRDWPDGDRSWDVSGP